MAAELVIEAAVGDLLGGVLGAIEAEVAAIDGAAGLGAQIGVHAFLGRLDTGGRAQAIDIVHREEDDGLVDHVQDAPGMDEVLDMGRGREGRGAVAEGTIPRRKGPHAGDDAGFVEEVGVVLVVRWIEVDIDLVPTTPLISRFEGE